MKRELFIDFLETVSSFSDVEKKLIFDHTTSRIFEKGSYLLKFGEISTDVNFIISGVIRFYIVGEDGEELTTAFISEGECASRIESFLKNTPSNGYLHCETSCDLITINKKDWVFLCDNTKNFGYAMGQLGSMYVAKKMELQRRLLTDDAQSAYLEFLKKHKSIADRVPMKHIASYLGITPSSLSRIKKK